MRHRLGLAAVLLTKPRLSVLDEPSNGLDPAGKEHVHGVLTRLAADGTSVVLSSHRMDDLEALCGEVTILATGRVVFSGPLSKLAAENGELDYRLVTSDPGSARRLAGETAGIRVVDDAVVWRHAEVLVVRAQVPALNALVVRLVQAGRARTRTGRVTARCRVPRPAALPPPAAAFSSADCTLIRHRTAKAAATSSQRLPPPPMNGTGGGVDGWLCYSPKRCTWNLKGRARRK